MELIKNDIESRLPDYWGKIFKCVQMEKAYKNNESISNYLYSEYKLKGYIDGYTYRELLDFSDSSIIWFYLLLFEEKQKDNSRPVSIVEQKNNPKWMFERDYCFFNIRAVGTAVEETGNIMDAVKILPALRVSGVHLAPFFECSNGKIYCQRSFYQINHEIVSGKYLVEGVSAKEQMKFFIDCCHLLNIAVGFDFVPHTSYDSALRLQRPDLFRWVKLDENKKELYSAMSIDQQYEDGFQKKCHEKVKKIVEKCKKEFSIQEIDGPDNSDNICEKLLDVINEKVYSQGYYTVPPHTWNGISVPGIKKYSYNMRRPIWEYKDKYGQDQGQHAIWLHSNFYIHKGMKANKLPIHNPDIFSKNKDFFLYIIDYLFWIITEFSFDYIRVDYVDHIFDNVIDNNGSEIALTETLTPKELNGIIGKLRRKWPGLGFQADHLGRDPEKYALAGFNLIIDSNVALETNDINLEKIFRDQMRQHSAQENCRCLWAIDTQDLAHPLFLGKELAYREGKMGTIVRFFMSRFVNVGKNRQPKYEVIGNPDLSTGIYRANNRPESIYWKSDKELLEVYNVIETEYMRYRIKLQEYKLLFYSIGTRSVVFTLGNMEGCPRLIGIIPIPFPAISKTDTIESFEDKVIISCLSETWKNGLTSVFAYKFSGTNQINYADIHEICALDYIVKEDCIDIEIKQRKIGLALIQVGEL